MAVLVAAVLVVAVLVAAIAFVDGRHPILWCVRLIIRCVRLIVGLPYRALRWICTTLYAFLLCAQIGFTFTPCIAGARAALRWVPWTWMDDWLPDSPPWWIHSWVRHALLWTIPPVDGPLPVSEVMTLGGVALLVHFALQAAANAAIDHAFCPRGPADRVMDTITRRGVAFVDAVPLGKGPDGRAMWDMCIDGLVFHPIATAMSDGVRAGVHIVLWGVTARAALCIHPLAVQLWQHLRPYAAP